MALQISNDQANQFEIKNPSLLQQALNHHELRSRDGTLATMQAENDKNVRKSRKMREVADGFQAPQIEITQATIVGRILQKVATMDPEEREKLLTLINPHGANLSDIMDEWQKRKGGNVFLELALVQEKSMAGNQAATIGRLSQEQADENQMTNMNQNLAATANQMQSEAHNSYEAQKKAEEAKKHSFWGMLGGFLAIAAILVVAVVVGVATGGAADAAAAPVAAEVAGDVAGEAAGAVGEAGATAGETVGDAAGEAADMGGDSAADTGSVNSSATNENPGEVDEDPGQVEENSVTQADTTLDNTASDGESGSTDSTQTAQESQSKFKQVWSKCMAKLNGCIGRGFRQLFSSWKFGVPTGLAMGGGAGALGYGFYQGHEATKYSGQATSDGEYITADATKGQIYTNDINLFNQDITNQNTAIQQLNDANSSAASFIQTAAQDMQQVQNIGNMFG